jgi:hypothetical protein
VTGVQTCALPISSGNVGIGTSSPTTFSGYTVLEVKGPSEGGRITANYNNSIYMTMFANSNGLGYVGTNSANPAVFITSGTERARIDTSGNFLVGTTNTAAGKIGVLGRMGAFNTTGANDSLIQIWHNGTTANIAASYSSTGAYAPLTFLTSDVERARIDSSGNMLVGQTSASTSSDGVGLRADGLIHGKRNGPVATFNRKTTDGTIVELAQDDTVEGTISVSGTTVSYNGGHLSRYAQTTTAKDDSIVKGTVLSNLDEMNVYTKDGQPVANEQLNKVKVSDTEGDANVAGVFVNWSHDEQHNVDEINMAMTGDMIIRIAQGVTVVRGDLLMSAGDGTAKPQGDDIVRSKTVAKVTSNHITCTYADGSYCVPCVLMAC